MTNIAISALPAGTTPLTGVETGIVVQGGVTSKISSATQAAGGAYIDCRDFAGLDPTGTTDSSAAINNAIQAGYLQHLPTYLAAGQYRIDSPLLFNNFAILGNAFTNAMFFGAGIGSYDLDAPSSPRTAIYPSFTDRPAIAIGPSTNATLRDMAIFGLNSAPRQYQFGGDPGYPVDNQSDYITPGCRSNRYSPYCGVLIDGLNVANPGGSSSNQYPDMTYCDGAGGSNFCTLENLHITGFVVGIAYGISGARVNTDDLVFRNVQIWWCDSAYAFGNPEADNCEIIHGNLLTCRQGLDGLNYGSGIGVPPRLRNVNLQYLYRIFTLTNEWGGFLMDGCYAESIRSLGNFGLGIGSDVRYAMTVIGGTYDFFGPASYVGKGPHPWVLQTFGPTTFIGVSLPIDGFSTGWDAFNVDCSGVPVSFERCTFSGPDNYVTPVFLAGFDTVGGQVRLADCWIGTPTGPGYLLSDDYVRGYAFSSPSGSQYCPGGRFIATYQSRRIPNANVELTFQPYASSQGAYEENTVYTIFAEMDDIVLSMDGAGSLTFKIQSTVLQPGDILVWAITDPLTGIAFLPALKVTSYTYSISDRTLVTCSLLFDPLVYSASPPTAGQLNIVLKHWAPALPLTCTTDGTTSIVDVSPVTILQDGDWVVGDGIAFGTRVVSGGGSDSITLSQATSTSGSNVSLFFGRLYAPTLTAVF